MSRRILPSQHALEQALTYDPETGFLHWKSRDPSMFKAGNSTKEIRCRIWNDQYAGRQAFTAINPKGHLFGQFKGEVYLAHRIIWKLHYGEEPDQIDHIDGNPSNNRIANLRNVTHLENHRNVKRHKSNTSGICGVSWMPTLERWRAYICVNRKQIHIGTFHDLSDAAKARKIAEQKYGFHENHGRF